MTFTTDLQKSFYVRVFIKRNSFSKIISCLRKVFYNTHLKRSRDYPSIINNCPGKKSVKE